MQHWQFDAEVCWYIGSTVLILSNNRLSCFLHRERCSNDAKYAVACCKGCSKKKGEMTAFEFQDKVLEVTPRCQAFTREGYRCQQPVLEGNRIYCRHHESWCPWICDVFFDFTKYDIENACLKISSNRRAELHRLCQLNFKGTGHSVWMECITVYVIISY